MARTRKGTPPSYPSTPHNGQARITVKLTSGKRHCLYLGAFGSSESRAEYQRFLSLLEAHGGQYPVKDDGTPSTGLTINEIALLFWQDAEKRYRLADGSPSRELEHFQLALDPLLDLHGHTLGREYGPQAYKALRQRLIEKRRYRVQIHQNETLMDRWLGEKEVCAEEQRARWRNEWFPAKILTIKSALARKVINQRMAHIKSFFAWAVAEELVPASVHEALLRVPGLRRGHTGTREKPKVKPVADEHVAATLPFLLPQVRAMVQLQPLIGSRETEVCLMRGRNIHDMDKPVWRYVIDPNDLAGDENSSSRLANQHKTGSQEEADGFAKVKILPIGPKAQALLKPWLRANPEEFLFQPCEAREARYAERRKQRKTPLHQAHVRQQARKKKAKPKRAPRDHYDRHSYGQAIKRAAKKAGVPHWHPHQLKHVCGTRVREEFGLIASKEFMGHEKVGTAEIYAEKSWDQIVKIALTLG